MLHHLDSTPLCIELVVAETDTLQCVPNTSNAGFHTAPTGDVSLSSVHSQAAALRLVMLLHLLKSAIQSRRYCHTYDLMLLHMSPLGGACEAILTAQEYIEMVTRRPWYWAALGSLLPTGSAASALVRCAVIRALQAPAPADVRCEALSAILHSATVQRPADSQDLLLLVASSRGSSHAFEALFEGVQRRLLLVWLLRYWDKLLMTQLLPDAQGAEGEFTTRCGRVAARALGLAACGDGDVDTSVAFAAKRLQHHHRQHVEDAHWRDELKRGATEAGVGEDGGGEGGAAGSDGGDGSGREVREPLWLMYKAGTFRFLGRWWRMCGWQGALMCGGVWSQRGEQQHQPPSQRRPAKRIRTADTRQPPSRGGVDRTELSPVDATMAVMCSQPATCSAFEHLSIDDARFQRWHQHLLSDPATFAVTPPVRTSIVILAPGLALGALSKHMRGCLPPP
jgi:hypothetical protein